MNWADEPATDTQFDRLTKLGCAPDHPLSKREASHLISWLEEHPKEPVAGQGMAPRPRAEPEAYRLRVIVEHARRASSSPAPPGGPAADLALAVARRQEYWLDTCREVTQMRIATAQVLELYQRWMPWIRPCPFGILISPRSFIRPSN
jgi:hypothetical protein